FAASQQVDFRRLVDLAFTGPAPNGSRVSSLLIIAPADLGEAALATGALEHVLTPDTETTIVCAENAADLFRAVPGVVNVQRLKPGRLRSWFSLGRLVGDGEFDLLVDLSGKRISFTARARKRVVRSAPRELRHVLEEFAALLGAERLKPRIW